MREILRVDLSQGRAWREPLAQAILDQYLGGRGLGAYLLYRETGPGVEPLSPNNPLIISNGPVQGTVAPFSAKTILHTKSPLTGIYLYSAASSTFGFHLAKLGLAALIVKGRSSVPTYLEIDEQGEVGFRPAGDLWGRDPACFYARTVRREGLAAGCLCIGLAGEKLIPLAAVLTGPDGRRTFGRGGSGCVMGAKNLKGMVIRSRGRVTVADPEGFRGVLKEVRQRLQADPFYVGARKAFGSGSDMAAINLLGLLPTRNWQSGVFPGLGRIAPAANQEEFPRESVACGPFCYAPCAHRIRIREGPYRGVESEGPEYETIYALGANCGVDRFDAIVAAEAACDRYGLDTMSVGVAVAFGMECREKGLIGQEDLGGLDLRFGNHEAVLEMVHQIARGEGFGAVLGRGVREAAGQIPGSEDFAMHAKGLELGGLECRGAWGQALQYALGSRGGCHHALGRSAVAEGRDGTGTRIAGKGELVKNLASLRILYDCAVLCTFPRGVLGPEVLARLVGSIRGRETTVAELSTCALRVLNLERLFNCREGIDRDILPGRLTGHPLPDGPNRGALVPLDELLADGYRALGWDQTTGRPRPETLAELGLNDLA